MQFRDELTDLINKHSKENGSDTPDFVLSGFIQGALDAFDNAVVLREEWYGRFPVSKTDQFTITGFVG